MKHRNLILALVACLALGSATLAQEAEAEESGAATDVSSAVATMEEPATPTGPQRAMSLREAIIFALERNQDIAIEKESVTIAEASIGKAKGAYDTTLRLESRYRDRIDPVNSILSGAPAGQEAPRIETLQGSTGLSKLLKTGASASLTAASAREWTDNAFTLLAPSYATSLALEVRQPLLQNRKIDPARRAIRIARVERGRSIASFQRTVAETIATVEKAYWSLVAAQRDVAVRRDAVTLARQQEADTLVRVQAGTAGETDLSQPKAEVERRRGELYAAEENARRADNQLKLLIARDDGDPLWSVEIAPTEPAESRALAVDLNTALDLAMKRRPEIMDARARISRQDIEVQASRDKVKPQLDLVGAWARRGLAGTPNPSMMSFPGMPTVLPPSMVGGYGRSLGTLADDVFPDASIGVTYSVPIDNRAARQDVTIARAQLRQTELGFVQVRQRVAVEVRNAAVAMRTALQRIEAARAGRIAAEEQLRAEKDRFDAGISTNFMVLTRQNDLAQARIVETAALTDYRKAVAEFARSTGSLLEWRRIQIDERDATVRPARS